MERVQTDWSISTLAQRFPVLLQVRRGEPVDNSDIIRFGQLFNDELTLDNLDRVQLVSMCQVRHQSAA